MLFPENINGKKKKIDLSQDTEFEMTKEKTLVSMCVSEKERKLYSGPEIQKICYLFLTRRNLFVIKYFAVIHIKTCIKYI